VCNFYRESCCLLEAGGSRATPTFFLLLAGAGRRLLSRMQVSKLQIL